jgi:hypothetical protein
MAQLFLFICLVLSLQSWGNSDTTYTLDDLEILSSEQNYEEFFKHAHDVRPSLRQERWKAMVGKMADLYSQNIIKKTIIAPEDFKQVENLYRLPVLKSDEFFRQRRSDIGVRYLQKCLKDANPCWNDVKLFWEADQEQPELAYKLAEITSPYNESSPLALWAFLDPALKSTYSEFYCQKPFVMKALWAKLEVDYIRLGPKGDLSLKIDQTIHPDCIPHLVKEARARLYSPFGESDRELGFQILKSQKKVDQRLSDFFYSLYLLERPSRGELFNYAWNAVKELGEKSERRDSVMKEIKKLDPLPDELLSSIDMMKKRAILNHFKNYFPEYLDFYASRCVDYYGGKTKFPNGNPTMHCQELMSSELAHELLEDYKIKQYQEVKKI